MDTEAKSQAHQALLSRRQAIADAWREALAQSGFTSIKAAELRQFLDESTEEAIALLLAESFDRDRAEAIGASLASFHYLEPDLLDRTQQVLAQQLIQGLPAEQVAALQPRLAALLGAVAAGFFRQARQTILAQQEGIRGTLIREVQRRGQALQEAYDEVEQRVLERTAELAEANEILTAEIAERKRAEQELRQSEERYRSLFENVPVGLYRVGPNNDLLDVNPTMVNMLGYPDKESLMAIPSVDLQVNVTAEDRRQRQIALERHGSLRDVEMQLRKYDGSVIWARSNFRATRDADGQVLYYEGSLEDITERKRVEMALRESEQTARALLNAPPDLASLIDTEGFLLDANEAMAQRYEMDVDELIGLYSWDLIPPEVAQRRKPYFNQVIRSGQPVQIEDQREGRWYHTVFYPVLNAQGEVSKIAVLSRDIDERKRAEEEIKRHNRELAALNAVAATVNSSLELEEVLNRALDKVLEMMELEVGAIRLLDQRDSIFSDLKVYRGLELSPRIVENISRVKITEGPLAEVVATGEPLMVEDISSHPTVETMGRTDLNSLAVIPLQSKGKVLGTMEIVRCDARPFTSEEIDLLSSVGSQIGMAIHNARLWQETERRLRESMVLLETGRALAGVLKLDDLLQLIVRSALETIECADSSVIHLLDDASGGLRPSALAGRPAGGFRKEGGERLSMGKGIAGCALQQGRVINVPDVSADPRFVELDSDGRFQSLLVAPLAADGKEIGTISVTGEQCGVFTPEDERLAMTLAAHAATAVKNAQLFGQSQELAVVKERNRIAGELHDRLAQNLASLLMKVDFGLSLMDSDPQATKELLAKVKGLARESIEEIRRSIFTLRRQELEEEGFVPGLREYVQAFEEQNALPVHLSIAGEEACRRLGAAHEYALFRIVQEALTNAGKHAGANQVWADLDLSAAEALSLTVRDDGVGFDEEQQMAGLAWLGGFGLTGMRKRAEAVGGELIVKSRPGWGTEIKAVLPLGGEG